MLLLDDRFDRQDPLFLEELDRIETAKPLGKFALRWLADPRPWARQKLLEYLDRPLDRPGHESLVKQLFKKAEQERDDEVMAHFLVAFDRHVRRVRKIHFRYDWSTRTSWEEERLKTPRRRMPEPLDGTPGWVEVRNPRTGVLQKVRPQKKRKRPRPAWLFRFRTRYYLRRRAWRYFRLLGFQRSADYPKAIATALKLYRDEHLEKGEHLLDSWGLMNACFRYSPLLRFDSSHIRLKRKKSLAQLAAAPRFPLAWKRPESAEILLHLVLDARSRVVRVFALELLRSEPATPTAGIPVAMLLRLLEHTDPEVQAYGATLLEQSSEVAQLPLETWLQLLRIENPTLLETICTVLTRHVQPQRFSLEQALQLAASAPAPLAHLGLELLRSRSFTEAASRQVLAGLANARSTAKGREMAVWALGILGSDQYYDRDAVSRFFDSRQAEVRAGAWSWLQPGTAGYADAALWSRLLETPFDDLRLRLIEALETRAKLPGVGPRDLGPVWCTVLLGVHRGGRQKQKAIRQIGRALQENPGLADTLLPVLGAAIRSVRGPEWKTGLAVLLETVEVRPQLTEAVRRYLPEIDLGLQEAS